MHVTLDNLSFERQGEVIFKQLNYDFAPGTLTLLRGASGCGKSTLMRIITGVAGLEYQGQVLINGLNLQAASTLVKAQQVGMVFQNPNQQFTMRTLRREIIFALENLGVAGGEISQRLERVSRQTQTEDLLDRTLAHLSGGEKQRASLAVVLAMGTPVLILDEPFASIDPQSRRELIALLGALRAEGKTIIISDHDLSDYQGHVDAVVSLSASGFSRESLTILDEQPVLKLVKELPTQRLQDVFDLEQVSYRQNKRALLLPTDFTFKTGITTLTGDNGSGKSTLLKSLVQLHPYQGKMRLAGQKLTKGRSLYRELTLGVQEASQQFVTVTPREELLFNQGSGTELSEAQRLILDELGLTTKLEHSLFHLSEGQKKMVQLIAMLSLEPKLLLLDEPFSGLDERASQIFMRWIEKKSSQTSFIIVSHRLGPLSGYSDFHVGLRDQSLQEWGPSQLGEGVAKC